MNISEFVSKHSVSIAESTISINIEVTKQPVQYQPMKVGAILTAKLVGDQVQNLAQIADDMAKAVMAHISSKLGEAQDAFYAKG